MTRESERCFYKTPAELGFCETRWNSLLDLCLVMIEQNEIPALGLSVGRTEGSLEPLLIGRQHPDDQLGTLSKDALFLIASLTKPVVAMGVLLLVERGILSLNDQVGDFFPSFRIPKKKGITIRQLLTHTSGLPDMLPNNQTLRESQATVSQFVEETAQTDSSFSPGYGVQYQSMGYALLGELIEKITGERCANFLRQELFQPLGMIDSELGAPLNWWTNPDRKIDRLAKCLVPKHQQDGVDWNWNSQYWLSLGAPWGGMISSPVDLSLFCRMILNKGEGATSQLFSPQTIEMAVRNQLESQPNVSQMDRRTRPWGFGWRLNWESNRYSFGDLLGPSVVGHWGATGSLMWIDPVQNLYAVILTTQPLEHQSSHLIRISNAIAASLLE